MSGAVTRWTSERVVTLKTVLGRHTTLRDGLRAASEALGFHVTRPAADAALARAGFVAAYQSLASPPLPVWDRDTDPSIPVADAVELPDDSDTTSGVWPLVEVDAPLGWRFTDSEERILFVPDCHWPYCDRAAWGVMLRCAAKIRPTRIVVLGDFLDFFQCSSHDSDPRRYTSVQSDLQSANRALDELDSLGATHKHFIEGNHEFRLLKYLWKRAPALLESMKLPELLRLGDRQWTWTPYRQHLQVGDVWVTHDTGHAGAWAHQRSGNDFMASTVIGHTHRLATLSFGNSLGQRFVTAMFGWLGSVPEADYLHMAKRMKDWSHGFGIGWQYNGHVHLQAVPIVNYSAVLGGEVVALDRS